MSTGPRGLAPVPRLLSWVQPADLLAHELVASAAEGKDTAALIEQWIAAGGSIQAPHGGAQDPPAGERLQSLARELLDALDDLPPSSEADRTDPTDLAEMEACWTVGEEICHTRPAAAELSDRIHGAWLGRAAGCLLGKPVEKVPRAGIREILQAQGRWPLRTWFTAAGLPPDVADRWPWNRRSAATSLAENIDGMPEDDDLNFPLVALSVLEEYGPDFSTEQVAATWLAMLPAGRVFTAERAAYRNLLLGLTPPATARHHNPYREWIGAQIRADMHGWVHPGESLVAARSAWRDARLSHTRAGVHGAMCVAAMCAASVTGDDVAEVLAVGLSVVPPHSRYAAAIRLGRELGAGDSTEEAALDAISAKLGSLHWVHVLPNAALVAFALSRSRGDFQRAICTVVMGGWDTDSNAATVGSVCGGLAGAKALPPQWVLPLRNRLSTSLPGYDGIGFDELADRTVALAAW